MESHQGDFLQTPVESNLSDESATASERQIPTAQCESERSMKNIRCYLKSCRRSVQENKAVKDGSMYFCSHNCCSKFSQEEKKRVRFQLLHLAPAFGE